MDGVLLVIDPQHPEQERDLEQLYIRFAQSHNLTMKQCCVLAVSQGDTYQGDWSGDDAASGGEKQQRLGLEESSA